MIGATFNAFLPPTFKTAVYGLIIGLIACFQGMRTTGGAEGVGRAATNSVVPPGSAFLSYLGGRGAGQVHSRRLSLTPVKGL